MAGGFPARDWPLTGWAQNRLDALAAMASIADLPDAAALLGERAELHGFRVPGLTSCHGGCRFYRTADGWVALNLARPADRELLPALFGRDHVADLDAAFGQSREADVVAQGRMLGMAIAGLSEAALSPACEVTATGPTTEPENPPRVVDLSALWAGPLASRLLQLTGAEVVRIESVGREDRLRQTDPAHFARLNRGKTTLRLDLRSETGRSELLREIARSDIVIEAARPRALMQLGIDADALVRRHPGLVWITITGHGIRGDAANWVGFGDDAAVAGGLSRELLETSGQVGFVGDAIADPLTGIAAAEAALRHWRQGTSARLFLSMSGIVRDAIAAEKARDPAGFASALADWAERCGESMREAMPC